MVTRATLDQLTLLSEQASAAPWFVALTNDDGCMSGIAVVTERPADDMFPSEFIAEKTVAACLVQEPLYVRPSDRRWNANAELITAVRNDLDELIRLARLGLQRD